MYNKIFDKSFYIIIIFYFAFSSLILYLFNLNISPDGREFLDCSKNLFKTGCHYQYFGTFIIFKILNNFNFELNFHIFNLMVFFCIYFFSIKILSHFDIELNNILKSFYLLFLFILNYDFFQWVNYALSDLILILNILISINLYLKSRYKLLILVILLSLLIKRQSVIMLLILFLIFLEKRNLNNSFLRSLFNIAKIYCPIILIVILFYFYEKLNLNINNIVNDFSTLLEYVFYTNIKDGVVVMNRVYVENNNDNILSIIHIYFLRFFYSLSFYFNDYSLKHKIYNILYFTFLTIPFVTLPFIKDLSENKKKLLNLNFSIVVLILIFIIITFIDYDMRYRIYFFPFIIMNNYILIDSLLKKIKIKY